jgi:flagellar protein FlgJ
MLNIDQANSYTDFNALAKLKNEAKGKSPEAIKEVAKQFESVFVGMMLKSMRQAKLADGIFDSSQSDFYQDMYDKELSVHLAGKQGIGLADLIAKQLSPDESVAVSKNQGIADYERQSMIRDSLAVSETTIAAVNNQEQDGIDSAEDFINQLRPYAEQAAKKLNVDANVLISQAALETGWGKLIIKSSDGHSSHNLFNIKADKSWQGKQAKVSTVEFKDGVAIKEIAGFRSYDSYQDSFDNYVEFIKTNPRYKAALNAVQQPEKYMQALQQAGYATDPEYAKKVMKIFQSQPMTNKQPEQVAMQTTLIGGR